MANTQPAKPKIYIRNPKIWAESGIFTLISMESVVFAAWYTALALPKVSWLVSSMFVWFAYLISYSIVRFLRYHKIKNKIRNFILAVWLIILAYICTKFIFYAQPSISIIDMGSGILNTIMDTQPGIEGFWHCLFFPILLWRSITLSKEIPGPYGAMRCFKISFVLLMPYAVLFGNDYLTPNIWWALGFIFFGLMTLSLTKLGYLSELRGGRLPKISLDRFLGIVGSAIVTTIITIGLSSIISGRFSSILIQMSGFLIILFNSLLILILTPLIRIFFQFVSKLFANSSGEIQINALDSITDALDKVAEENATNRNQLPEFVQKYTGLFILIAIVVVVLIIAYLSLQWQMKKMRAESDLEKSDSSSRSGIGLLAGFLKPNDGTDRNKTSIRGLLAAARIHQIYAKLMRLSSKLGSPRHVAVTPLEFVPQLVQLFPQEEKEITLITNAFMRVRYGELPESEGEVTEIVHAWKLIEHQGHILMRNRLIRKENLENSRH